MELASFVSSHVSNLRSRMPNHLSSIHHCSSQSCSVKKKKSYVQFALPETAASILVASVAVGAAATLLAKRLKPSETSTVHVSSIYSNNCYPFYSSFFTYNRSAIWRQMRSEPLYKDTNKLIHQKREKKKITKKINFEPWLTEALKDCEECSGSGLCSECNGEGYVFKKISEESARKARTASKTAATRYTAGLPTKWTYCSKCSSARSCRTCGGSGQVKL